MFMQLPVCLSVTVNEITNGLQMSSDLHLTVNDLQSLNSFASQNMFNFDVHLSKKIGHN